MGPRVDMAIESAQQLPLLSDAGNAALQRVLGSQAFAKTARLSSFLRHVYAAQSEQRLLDLTEQRIGQLVFGRAGHYNPAEDTIVRTTARLLRQRLAAYYASEGAADPWRIAIPRGGYAPVLLAAGSEAAAHPGEPVPSVDAPEAPVAEPPAPPRPEPLPRRGLGRLQAALAPQARRRQVLLATVMATAGLGASPTAAPRRATAGALWDELFVQERNTLFVPADSNLVFYQLEVLRQLSLEDYLAKRVEPDPGNAHVKFLRNRQSSISSVALAMELGKRAGAAPERLQTRFARDLRLNELKQANAILLGVRQSNPWVDLFRPRLNFHIDWDIASEKFLVRNDRPLPGEQAEYEFSKHDPDKLGYAQIAYLRGLGGDNRVLLVAGTTALGAEAAEEFVLDPLRMDPLMQQAMAADGRLREFELLLQFVMQAGGSTNLRIVGLRVREA